MDDVINICACCLGKLKYKDIRWQLQCFRTGVIHRYCCDECLTKWARRKQW